jgi:hypothetical protein
LKILGSFETNRIHQSSGREVRTEEVGAVDGDCSQVGTPSNASRNEASVKSAALSDANSRSAPERSACRKFAPLRLAAVALVLAIELVNSAFEALVDHLHPDIHPEIRIIKDMVAGSVLLSAIGAVLVGLLLLASQFWK